MTCVGVGCYISRQDPAQAHKEKHMWGLNAVPTQGTRAHDCLARVLPPHESQLPDDSLHGLEDSPWAPGPDWRWLAPQCTLQRRALLIYSADIL